MSYKLEWQRTENKNSILGKGSNFAPQLSEVLQKTVNLLSKVHQTHFRGLRLKHTDSHPENQNTKLKFCIF